jgi:transcription elongation GreA/GreB family factor
METEVETVEIVDAHDADFRARRISAESPIGRALLGCRAGQSVMAHTPGGPRLVHLLEVSPHLLDDTVQT